MSKYPSVRQLFLRALGDPTPKGAQKRVSEIVGVKPASVTRWVKGEARPGSEHWASLASALEVELDEVRQACGWSADEALPLSVDALLSRLDQFELAMIGVVQDTSATRGAQIARVTGAVEKATEAVERLESKIDDLQRRVDALTPPAARKHKPGNSTPHSGVARR